MRAEFTKHGPRYDYRTAHVTLTWNGRTIIGQIVSVRRNETLGCVVADVRYFCGDPWPITPRLAALEILERTYD